MNSSVTRTVPVWLAMAAIVTLAAGCASKPESDPVAQQAAAEENDPWEETNRGIFSFNRGVDDTVAKPVARAYRDVVPQFGRDSISNFIQNMGEPVNFVNAVLQGADDRAAETAVRFIFNTTAGVGGFFDVAEGYGLPVNQEDFGQTLAVWGAGEGPYIMLPLFGPSNVRDTVGRVVDQFSNPIGYFMPTVGSVTTGGFGVIGKREENLETLQDLEDNSVDYYAALRNLYRQNRDDAIRNGAESETLFDIEVVPDD